MKQTPFMQAGRLSSRTRGVPPALPAIWRRVALPGVLIVVILALLAGELYVSTFWPSPAGLLIEMKEVQRRIYGVIKADEPDVSMQKVCAQLKGRIAPKYRAYTGYYEIVQGDRIALRTGYHGWFGKEVEVRLLLPHSSSSNSPDAILIYCDGPITEQKSVVTYCSGEQETLSHSRVLELVEATVSVRGQR